jgi:hypothetical protein
MPKFHIDVCMTFEKVPDRVGRELADRKEATKLAVRYIRLLLAKVAYRDINFRCLVIRDEFGRLITTLPFRSHAIQVPVAPSSFVNNAHAGPSTKPLETAVVRMPRSSVPAVAAKQGLPTKRISK